eukprot:s462_g20.t1
MVLTRVLLCLGIAFCAAQDASCESEHTSLIQDHASHAGQRVKTEEEKTEKAEKSPNKLDASESPKKIDSLLQLDSASAAKSKTSESGESAAQKAMADWIARDLKSF